MLEVLKVTFPFFALVFCGYVAAWQKMMPVQAIPGLNGFVLFFALPCMLYSFGAHTRIDQLLNWPLFCVYLLAALLIILLVLAFSLNAGIRWNDAAFGALVTAFPNTGFIGVPLLVALFGQSAAGPAIVTLVVDLFVTSSLCIALSRLDEHENKGANAALLSSLSGMFKNPLPWAIALGVLTSWLQLELPAPIHQTIGLLADAASPVALFTVGAVLARPLVSQTQSGKAPRLARLAARQIMPPLGMALLKLCLHPLLMFFLGISAILLGLPLVPGGLTVAIAVAALPSASNVVILSERYGARSERIASIVLMSTLLAFFSFSAVVSLLK